MQPDDYAAEISLYEPWVGAFSLQDEPGFENDKSALYRRILEFLLNEPDLRHYLRGGSFKKNLPEHQTDQRRLIQELLTLRPPDAFPRSIWRDLDLLFCSEAADREKAKINTGIECIAFTGNMGLWRGDITTLAADAIVNAANSALLGCFEPFHACIDNAIHSAAGPRLRDDCAVIMDMQGQLEATGQAKITRAYALPSRFVLHTVGPIVPDHMPTEQQRVLLSLCYINCLECCKITDNGLVDAGSETINSIAFCGVSTGVFGYPPREAAAVAINTVRKWLEASSWKPLIIFNVFSAKDEEIYKEEFGGAL